MENQVQPVECLWQSQVLGPRFQPWQVFCIAKKVQVLKKDKKGEEENNFLPRSSQLLRASGGSRGFQVTLKLSHCGFVQGTEIKVKSCVCDVEVSSLFDEVYYL